MSRFATATASFRENSEDRALVLPLGEHWVVCVADGSGGMSGGAKAAEIFVAGASRAIESHAVNLNDSSAWVALLKTLDDEIEHTPLAGETTGIALAITHTFIVGASVGDSHAWLFTETSSELTQNQARKPRLGTGRAVPRPFTAQARGTLVVGTDGLFDYSSIEDIRAIACTAPPNTADAIVQLPRARCRTLPDDVAVVIGWLDESVPPRERR